jgi:hypothetical protein
MTASNDLERRIADFYATEPALRAPDRVLADALTTIESMPQRRVIMQAPWRFRPVNTYTKLAIAAVAIVAVAFAMRTLVPGNDVGSPPTPAPTATSLPSTTPNATPTQPAAFELPGDDRVLDPALYYVDVPGSDVRAEFTVVDGGWRGNGWYLSGPDASISFWAVANVYPDACEESIDRLPDPPTGPSVEDLVAALDAQANTELQSISTPNVGGYPSTQIVMEPSTRLGSACVAENMQLWVGPGGALGRALDTSEPPGGEQDVMWIVDADGNRVVIVAYYDPGSTSADAVEEIIASIEFDVP